MAPARSRKQRRHIIRLYFLMKPRWMAQTRQRREPEPNLSGCERMSVEEGISERERAERE
jgi:hypothetical protein